VVPRVATGIVIEVEAAIVTVATVAIAIGTGVTTVVVLLTVTVSLTLIETTTGAAAILVTTIIDGMIGTTIPGVVTEIVVHRVDTVVVRVAAVGRVRHQGTDTAIRGVHLGVGTMTIGVGMMIHLGVGTMTIGAGTMIATVETTGVGRQIETRTAVIGIVGTTVLEGRKSWCC
jgi:hypothetical protein